MALINGFQYVQGPYKTFLSTISSTATFKAFNPVAYGLGRTLVEATSADTVIVGIAQHDAANSIYAGKCLVLAVFPETVFATKTRTNIAASNLSAGIAMDITKSGNYIMPADSRATAAVIIVPRQDGSTIDSTDSSIWVQFLTAKMGPYASSTSTLYPG